MRKPLIFARRRASASASEFEALLRPHVEFLYRLAYRFTGAVADAEDLLQDTLIKLLPRVQELHNLERPRPWLARVLYHQFVDDVRRRGRSALAAASAERGDGDRLAQLPSLDDGPEQSLERSLLHAHLARALGQLAPEQRAVVALHDIEGYRLEELEQILETPIGTLKSRLHRARHRLRGLLAVEPFSGSERVRARGA